MAKLSRSAVRRRAHALPAIKFEKQEARTLTSFSGLVLFQAFFSRIRLKVRLARCFASAGKTKTYAPATLFLQLIIHLLLGFRELRDCRYYEDDPLIQRVLGLRRLPDAATLSRMLKAASEETVRKLRRLLRDMVLERLLDLKLARITLDFDGSVQSTRRRAQGTAVGFNKKKKGARSYYPLFCTVAQTGQVLDFLHRSGNVHDSNGAMAFILECVAEVRRELPWVIIETRMDSAFFSDELVQALTAANVEFSISVPFERFVELKRMIDQRKDWSILDEDTSYFQSLWKPKCWMGNHRFLLVRTRAKQQIKGAIQLDLFVPYEYGYEFKVIVTNKTIGAAAVITYHEGRGSQEGMFAELKTDCHLDYVPVRRLYGNQTYLLAGLFAHNLTRELQMQTSRPSRRTTPQRATLWVFEKVSTLRKTLIQRAGRFTRPQGSLTLTVSAGKWMRERFEVILHSLAA
jgi:hypothetical protein